MIPVTLNNVIRIQIKYPWGAPAYYELQGEGLTYLHSPHIRSIYFLGINFAESFGEMV